VTTEGDTAGIVWKMNTRNSQRQNRNKGHHFYIDTFWFASESYIGTTHIWKHLRVLGSSNCQGSQHLSEKELEEIREIINSMQSRLIQLFDELRELRQRLNMMSDEAPAGSAGTVVPIFSEVRDTSVVTERQSKGTDSVEPETMVPVSEHVPEMRP
jgi:hypothetical protein